MAYTLQKIYDFTKLPLRIIDLLNKNAMAIFVKTPHKGEVELNFKERIYGFFGIKGEITKTGQELIAELQKLENESKDFLLDEWIQKFN